MQLADEIVHYLFAFGLPNNFPNILPGTLLMPSSCVKRQLPTVLHLSGMWQLFQLVFCLTLSGRGFFAALKKRCPSILYATPKKIDEYRCEEMELEQWELSNATFIMENNNDVLIATPESVFIIEYGKLSSDTEINQAFNSLVSLKVMPQR